MEKSIKDRLFFGDLYQCISANDGIGTTEKLICRNLVFVKFTNYYMEFENLKKYANQAQKYTTKANKSGEYFVTNLRPYTKKEEHSL